MSEVVTENPIKAAAKAAFPYSMPMLAGFLFLGIAYGIYMKALGFGVSVPCGNGSAHLCRLRGIYCRCRLSYAFFRL